MRNFIAILLVVFCTLGLIANDVQAKRFGGGRSFGMSRSIGSVGKSSGFSSFGQSSPSTGNRWLGPLAGLAIGGLLTSLFMGHGFGTGMLTWLALGGIALLVMNLLRQRSSPQPHAMHREQAVYRDTSEYFRGGVSSGSAATTPAWFNETEFLRDAKSKFIRLQAAYDQKNLDDIRKFTTPEVFAEIQLQFHERGENSNHTEVVSLNAQSLDLKEEGQDMVASVRFTGMIREELDAPTVSMNEIWHFKRDVQASEWIVAGVQQH